MTDSAPNPSTALARVVVDELARNGVTRVALSPGSRSAPLALAAADHPGIDLHVEVDERSAAFFALGVGKAGVGPAAVVTTSGSPVGNLLPAVIEADTSDTPLLLLTADRPPELRHAGANQAIDQLHVFGRAVRWFCEVGVAESLPTANRYWRSTVCRGVADARGLPSRPGPVHLNLAFREPLVPVSDDGRASAEPFSHPLDGRLGGAPWTAMGSAGPPVIPLPGELAVTDRGIVLATDGPWGAWAEGLAQRLGWPLVAQPGSGARKGSAITTASYLAGHPGVAGPLAPEVAIRLGRPPLSRPVAALWARAEHRVVVDPFGWSDPDRDATLLLRALPQVDGPPRPPGPYLAEWRRAETVARMALDASLDAFERPTELRAARDAALAVPEGGTLVVASSMPVRDLDAAMPGRSVRVAANRGASGIDGFVSTALGLAAARPPVVALAGDLSILHDASGFLLDPLPDCVFVVIDNDGGGIFHFLPQARFPEHFERVFAAPRGRSFERLAALHGLGHAGVERPADLVGAVRAALAAGGCHLVTLRTDRVENVEVHRAVTEAVDRSLEGLFED